MKFRFLYLFLLLGVIPLFVHAQGFKYLNINNGLSSNQVFQVEKDGMGFMWFITNMSIDRFDGSQIKHYRLREDNVEYERYPSFTQMLLNNNGEILIALQGGKIFKYNKHLDDFELVFDIKKKIDYDDLLLLYAYVDTNNRFWFLTNHGVFLFNSVKDDFKSLFIFDNEIPTRIVEDDDGFFYMGTNKCLYKLAETTPGNFALSQRIVFGHQYGKVTCLLHQYNKIYIGTESKGLYVVRQDFREAKSLFPAIPHVVIRSVNYVPNDKIIVGTDGSGLYLLDFHADELISYFDSDRNAGNELTSNSIYDIAVDEDQRLWITTYANGVNMIDPLLANIQLYSHIHNEPNSLINNQVNVVLEDADGNLWIGTNNGVSCLQKSNHQWKHYLNDRKRKAVIISLCEDSQGHIWAGSYGSGAFRIEKEHGRVTNFQKDDEKPQHSINTNYIYALYADDESVWIGGLWGGLARYNVKNDTYKIYDIEVLGEIKPLNENTLLLGTPVGFCMLDKASGRYQQYTNFGEDQKKNVVRSFYVVNENEIWLGSVGGGLLKFNTGTGDFQAYTTKDGLPSNYIYSMENDGNGNIWITTERSIACFNRQTKQVYHVGEYLGLGNYSFVTQASAKRHNNNLVFGTTAGALELPLNKLTNVDVKTAKLILTDFRLFYNVVDVNGKNSPLRKAINETQTLSLTHKQNSFSFDFSAINYRSQKQIIYSYILEGFDQAWYTMPENNHTVSYTNISPGDYVFKLRALNKDTKALIDERRIAIHISPPFWKSGWAFVLYITLFAIVLRFVIQYVKNTIEKQYTKEKIEFFVNMAHDIRTPVSLIKAPLNDLSEKEELTDHGKTALDIAIRNTDKLTFMITQLLDFQKADISSLHLTISKHELKAYMLEKKLLYEVEAERKRIRFTMEMDFDRLYVWFDGEKMDKIINNLLTNAIKYTPTDGSVTIKITHTENHWCLYIIDTGIGIPFSEQKHLFSRFFRAKNAINSKETGSGIGLLLTRKLVRLHGGTISFTSQENMGTTFELTFKKGAESFLKKESSDWHKTRANKHKEEELVQPPIRETIEQKKAVKILLAEDNDDMRWYLKSNLSIPYQIVEASDGQEALDLIQEDHPDLIIADYLMPRLNGDELCAKLKRSVETCHIPIIMLTALNDKKYVLKGFEFGADDYITKPFDIAILKAKIKNILQSRENLKQALRSSNNKVNSEYINPLDKEFIEKAIQLIEENLEDPTFSMNDFCFGMGMSRSSLYNKLKALTDQGPNDFIKTIRLNKAKELLLTKQYNVFETSIMTGFSDPKYFSTIFKKHFGVSPSKILNAEEIADQTKFWEDGYSGKITHS